MKATEQLKAEHVGIKLMLSILEKICERFESKKDIDVKHLDQILEFIKVFADKCHHAKEESVLFPIMEMAGVSREGGPIGVMLKEHKAGREYIKGMSEHWSKYKSGDRKSAPKFVHSARKYSALLTQHIEKEDTILYPMADMRITEERQREIAKEFEKIEAERMGAGTHEKFHELIHHLKDIYV